MESWFTPTQAGPLPAARRVWALAPHPDDEIFGPGGALRQYRASGTRVEVDILTDGTGYAQAQSDQASHAALAERRRAESVQALAVLGLDAPQFWALPDRGLSQRLQPIARRIQTRLQQAYDEGQPIDVLLVPSLHEIHPDHSALVRAAVLALLDLQATLPAGADNPAVPGLLMYEVGAPLQPNLLLDISADWALKHQAMQCFASQLQHQDYARHVEGLNAYRSYYLGPEVRHVEALRWVPPDALTQLSQRLEATLARGHPWQDEVLALAEAQTELMQDQLLAREQQMAQTLALLRELGERFEREMLAARNTLAQQQQTLAELQWARDHGLAEKQALTHDLLAQQARYTQDVQQLQRDLAQSQHDVQQVQEALKTCTSHLQSLQNSWSWKLTAPLRWLRR